MSTRANFGSLSRLTEGVYVFSQPDWTWGLNNCGVIIGDEEVLVIDTCFTEARSRALRAQITDLTPKPVRYLVNTHHHGDHTFGNFVFPEATRIGHSYCREKVLAEGLVVQPFFPDVDWGDIVLAPPTVCFTDRLRIELGSRVVELISVAPAHTLGDVIVWLPEEGIVFGGDVALNGCTPVLTDGSLAGTRQALRTMIGLGARMVVSGHGPVGDSRVFGAVQNYLDVVESAADKGKATGLDPLAAARATDLGRFADWSDSERLVANIARTYSELDGEPIGTPLKRAEIAPMMTSFAGRPLRCLA